MIDAENYHQQETLKDGTVVTVRAVRPDDKQAIVDGFEKLDPQSIFMRFFHHKEGLSDRNLRTATEVDFDEVVALVVTVGDGEKQSIIAGARYMLLNPGPGDERSAEVAFLVLDHFQGKGLGGRLLEHLARIGRVKGVTRFVADVLPRNVAMLTVFSGSGLPMTRHTEDGCVNVGLDLTD